MGEEMRKERKNAINVWLLAGSITANWWTLMPIVKTAGSQLDADNFQS